MTDVTSRSVTLQWSPPFNTGGVELTGYIIEKRLATTHKWERVATVDTSVTLHTLENLKEKCQYYFRLVPCTTFFNSHSLHIPPKMLRL